MSSYPGKSVTVLGLGPMGRSLAAAFLAAGLGTTVWNRTPGRDRELAERGAVSAGSAAEAVAASDLTVVCVVNYDASDAILRDGTVTESLRGRTVVNLTAGTPRRARQTAAWAAGHGIGYLDGAILPPIFAEAAENVDGGDFSGDGNPITSAASSMAHIVHTAEEHGIDSGVLRAAEGLARRTIGLGHGTDGFIRIAEVLGRR